MQNHNFSKVEKVFHQQNGERLLNTKIPYITVDNYPKLGLFTALRFLEWALENPNGVISLPTGRTPEYFIKWTQHLLDGWNSVETKKLRTNYGLSSSSKPKLSNLQFIQIDEFYPIASRQQNSFWHFVNEYYIKGFGLSKERAQLINCDTIPLPDGKHFSEVFEDGKVDISLRYREPKSNLEALQQKAIFSIDQWCSEYDMRIRERGGIDFFLGGIGPDGHIAFNTRGSDHHSSTRLTPTNFETQAAAAQDLGGMEVARHRHVITIGLETITYNPNAVAIIFAAGEAKAQVVKDAIESEPSNLYPASSLQKLKNAKFYLTNGAASALHGSLEQYYKTGTWTQAKTERAVIDLCQRLEKYGHHITLDDLRNDTYCQRIPNLSADVVRSVEESIMGKITRGMEDESNQVYLHTGPHHDDIMLGIQPHIHRLLRNETNKAYFCVLTSGFTSVTNNFLKGVLEDTKSFLDNDLIQMVEYTDFFESGYKFKWDKDVYHFLNRVASGEYSERRRGLAHRVTRSIVSIYGVKNKEELRDTINDILSLIRKNYEGEKDPPKVQKLKGMIREFEEELVWGHFGIQADYVKHLRLGFYTGDIFTEQPSRDRDVKPILEELKRINPTVISLAFDPEGSGPDTHYKVLQAIAEAIRLWGKEKDVSNLRVWGYRNVWYKFHPAEVDAIVPVSLNGMSVLEDCFCNCYMSQVDASFPSYKHDGKFSDLMRNTWVEQLKNIQLLLGKNYFYQHNSPRLRSSHGLLLFKEMSVDEFLSSARELERSIEGMPV